MDPATAGSGATASSSLLQGDALGLGSLFSALLLPLLIVAALLVALLVLRLLVRERRQRAARELGLGDGALPVVVLARHELSAQHSLYVVRAGSRCLLLGAAPGGLNLLGEVEPLSREVIAGPVGPSAPSAQVAA